MKATPSIRVVPRWAAALFARLSVSAPTVVTEQTIATHLQDLGSAESATSVVKKLVRHGWLRPVGVHGAWAFLPPGVDALADPYLGLRGWRAVEPTARFALAGESALWHLGYLTRRSERVTVWMPKKEALPRGLTGKMSVVTTEFAASVDERALGPTLALLKKRHLDVTGWASRLPAFGPEALIVQMAQRPHSVASWVEVAPRLADLVHDADVERLKLLLSVSTDAAKQRAAYYFHLMNAPFHAMSILELLKKPALPVDLGNQGTGRWDKLTNVTDRLVYMQLDADAKG